MTGPLDGRRVVITGSNTGVGRATAEALAAMGARVVLACRSAERAADVMRVIGPERAELVELDLGSLASVRAAAAQIASEPGDELINNAAVAGARGQTEDGFELAFGVNHLGHFALTRLLLDALSEDGRVVHLGSGSHEGVRSLELDAVHGLTRSRLAIAEYATSKLCQMLFHAELSARFEGTARRSVAADPGDVASDAYRNMPCVLRQLWTWRMKPPTEGARPSLFCVTSPDAENGGLYDADGPREPSALARDAELAAELWRCSDAWSGLASPSSRAHAEERSAGRV